MNQKSPNDPKSILILTMKLLLTYFWKRLPIDDLILLTPISLAFSKSSQIGPSSSNHLTTRQNRFGKALGKWNFMRKILGTLQSIVCSQRKRSICGMKWNVRSTSFLTIRCLERFLMWKPDHQTPDWSPTVVGCSISQVCSIAQGTNKRGLDFP